MPGEDQERFEDYTELEQYLEELQAGQNAKLPDGLTPEKARIYRMAALLRSASPEAGQLRPGFTAELYERLEQERQQEESAEVLPSDQKKTTRKPQKATRHVSRRAILTGSAAIAASLAVGAGIGSAIEQGRQGQASHPGPKAASDNHDNAAWSRELIPAGTGSWIAVTTLSTLGESAVRFSSDALVGYVIRSDEQEDSGEPVIAFSAACTHMGCIVKWQDTDRRFHCPCHGGVFTEYGEVDASGSAIRYLNALPRLRTKIEHDTVFVEVPASFSGKA